MNSKFEYDIKDDELRVIGKSPNQTTGQNPSGQDSAKNSGRKDSANNSGRNTLRRMLTYVFAVAIAVAVIAGGVVVSEIVGAKKLAEKEIGIFDDIDTQENSITAEQIEKKFGMEVDPLAPGFTEKKDTIINDIPLTIFIPHNAKAELYLRTPDINDTSIVFCAQAADIRKDNKKINAV